MSKALGIAALTSLGLPLNWDVLRLGWEGVGGEPRLLSLEDIKSFADLEVVSASERQLPDVAELCTATSEQEVREALERLAPNPSVTALRVWRAVLLQRFLGTAQTSPVDTLADMNEFWGSFGYPQDSPHVVQGVGNSISPQEYYTEEIAGRALEEHQRWLGLELELLREAMRGHGSGIRKT